MSENGEIYTAGKNLTLPPAVTAVHCKSHLCFCVNQFKLWGVCYFCEARYIVIIDQSHELKRLLMAQYYP